MIGDRWRDIEAGRRAHVGATVLIECGYEEESDVSPDARVTTLSQAVDSPELAEAANLNRLNQW